MVKIVGSFGKMIASVDHFDKGLSCGITGRGTVSILSAHSSFVDKIDEK